MWKRKQVITHDAFGSGDHARAAGFGETLVTSPTVCGNRASGCNCGGDGWYKARAARVGHSSQANAADFSLFVLDHDEHEGLALGAPTAWSRFHPTHVCLVGLHNAEKAISARPNLGSPELVQPGPPRS